MLKTALSTIQALVLCSIGTVFAFSSSIQPQGEPAVPSASGPRPVAPEAHGDGVSSRYSVSLSAGLLTDATGEQVRMVSYVVDFLGTGRVSLGRMHGLLDLKGSSTEEVVGDLSGLCPDLMSAAPTWQLHSYTLHIYPRTGMSWAEVSADDVVVDVVRTK